MRRSLCRYMAVGTLIHAYNSVMPYNYDKTSGILYGSF